jgi:hypothetical protein
MSQILRTGTQHTIPIRWTVALLDLLGCREAIFRKLPEEDSDFHRGNNFPNVLGMGNRGALLKLII